MAFVVTGISPDGDVAPLDRALAEAHLPAARIEVVGPTDGTAGIASYGIASPGFITGGGLETGTGVPGLTQGRGTAAGSYGAESFRSEALADRLGDFDIPDDEIENYVAAIEAGRSVIAYFATAESVGRVTEIFRAAGLAKVKVF